MLSTRLTERLDIRHPIISAPMAFAAGGALAAAVTHAGGLGLIGGGYGDSDWLKREFAAAGNARVGAGFITWSMAKDRALLTQALSHAPAALMLSFGDPRPFAAEIAAAGSALICQVQSLAHAREATEAGAAIIVAQGTEAGGHGADRATMTLVPEIADLLACEAPQTLLVAAGGIADGRGLAAALALGADGVLMGSRFWAASEALTHPHHQGAALAANGDGTIRQRATDIARGHDWPRAFTARVLNNRFVQEWEPRPDAHRAAAEGLRAAYQAGVAAGDPDEVGVWVGEATGLIHDIAPAAAIIERTVSEAEAIIARLGTLRARV
ncbi:MAG: nitronate monooxygenase [Bosea sp.]|nr:nitronate monooxygenase [Bosea sp. (in: a-proteobacteria)]